jgi:hypothetical protein
VSKKRAIMKRKRRKNKKIKKVVSESEDQYKMKCRKGNYTQESTKGRRNERNFDRRILSLEEDIFCMVRSKIYARSSEKNQSPAIL